NRVRFVPVNGRAGEVVVLHRVSILPAHGRHIASFPAASSRLDPRPLRARPTNRRTTRPANAITGEATTKMIAKKRGMVSRQSSVVSRKNLKRRLALTARAVVTRLCISNNLRRLTTDD